MAKTHKECKIDSEEAIKIALGFEEFCIAKEEKLHNLYGSNRAEEARNLRIALPPEKKMFWINL